jgi:excisionase family DNA binding protein
MVGNRDTVERLAVSVERAATMAGVGRTTLYAALSAGSLQSLKIGKRRLIKVQALEAWINAHEIVERSVAGGVR